MSSDKSYSVEQTAMQLVGRVGTTTPGGWPQTTDGSGWTQSMTGVIPADVSGTTITTITQTAFHQYLVPAAEFELGSKFEWDADGGFTTGVGVPSAATFFLMMGATTIVSLAIPGAIQTGLTNAGWYAKGTMCVLVTGSSGSMKGRLEVGWHTAAGVTGSAVYFATTTQATTLATNRNMSMEFKWGSVPASTSLTCDQVTFGRTA